MKNLKNLFFSFPAGFIIGALLLAGSGIASAQVVIPELWKIVGTNLVPKNSSLTVGNSSTAATFSTLTVTSCTGCAGSSVSTTTANTWSALQQFQGNASTTKLSVYTNAYFGGTATSSFNSLGNLFFPSGGIIDFNSADVTLTHSSNALTLAGGNFALGANSLTMTGSIAATGARVTKGWFTDVESTNMFTVGGTSLSSTFAPQASPTFTGNLVAANVNFSGTATSTGVSNLATTTISTVASSTAATNRNRTLYVDGSVAVKECTLTDGATVTWDLSRCSYAVVNLGGNRTLDITNETQAIGQSVRLVACANGGSYTITSWDSAIMWPAKTAPTQTGSSGSCDTFAGFVTAGSSTPKIFLGSALNF